MDESCLFKSYLDDSWRGPSPAWAKCATSSHSSSNNSEDAYEPSKASSISSRIHIDIQSITKLQKEHAIRRREHNRQAQRACRERRVQYTLDLEAKIEELSESVQILQDENCKLIRQVCDLRAENIDLGTALPESQASKIGSACGDCVQSLAKLDPEPVCSTNKTDLKPLHQPFLALWNLMSSYLGIECSSRDLAAALEQLKSEVVLTARDQPT